MKINWIRFSNILMMGMGVTFMIIGLINFNENASLSKNVASFALYFLGLILFSLIAGSLSDDYQRERFGY